MNIFVQYLKFVLMERLEQEAIRYFKSILPLMSAEGREEIRALVLDVPAFCAVIPKPHCSIRCPEICTVEVNGKRFYISIKCWKTLNHVIQNGPTEFLDIAEILNEDELDEASVNHLRDRINRVLSKAKSKQRISCANGFFALK
ncbi:MAG: hypothetical protein LBQ54_07555 [Planctomycetaceae bacterium]|jgi:hypothetical protein|nr:hypothetical protein [Planctomycetaceae bacterium]